MSDYIELLTAHDKLLEKSFRLEAERDRLKVALQSAVDLVDRDIIRVRPSDKPELITALTEWNEALSTVSDSGKEPSHDA